jgi:SAM-dependent methyltransferase
MKASGARTMLDGRLRSAGHAAFHLLRATAVLAKAERYDCNLCGYSGRFLPFGDPPRRGALCGRCRSAERHRLLGLWVSSNPDAVDGRRVLHFAPEAVTAELLRGRAGRYRSADLDPGAADIVLDIEDITLPDESVDLVVCSHVLEHVDDAKALHQIGRILAPGGRALLMFPIVEGWERTYENAAHASEVERIRYFGQRDHVRMFGRDVRDRIRRAGFGLDEFTAEEPFVARHGLQRGQKVFVATKV